MGKTGAREDRELLAADQSIQSVYGRNAGLDKLSRIRAGCRVHRKSVDIFVFLCEYLGAAVYRLAHSVENTAEHIFGYSELKRMPEESYFGFCKINALSVLKQLNDCSVTLDLEDFTSSLLTVLELYLGKFIECNAFNMLNDHQRACDLFYCFVLFNHSSSPPAAASSICAFISATIASYSSSNLS